MSVDRTFDEVWSRTGLGEADHPPRATIRGVGLAWTGGAHLPLLSISSASDEGPEGDSQLIVEHLLGEGGMGQVHLARQPLLDREVAIKRVRDDAPTAAAASLLREARTMGSLEHPNILPVHALGADDQGRPILVMKRVNGASWGELIEREDHPAWRWWTGLSTHPLARHVEVLISLCRAVQFAHERGVLHLDLKPENAMLADDGGVYVLDWGVSRRLEQSGPRGVAGTPAYMAPELVDPSLTLSPATDVYLLGGCLHEVLAGRPPHGGLDLKTVLAHAHRSEPPVFGAAVPGELAAICTRCLAAEPEERFGTVRELMQALTGWIRTRGSQEMARQGLVSARRLEALLAEPEPDPIAVARLFAEARIGMEGALEQWPENPVAEEGLRSVLVQMAVFEIQRENLDHARALVEDLGPKADSSLRAQIEAVQARLAARRSLVEDADLGVAWAQRSAFVAVLGVAGFLVSGTVLGGLVGDPSQFTTFGVLMVGLLFNGVIWGLVVVGRQWLFRNAVNTSITATVVAIGLVVLVGRWIGHVADLSVAEVFSRDLYLMGGTMLVAGIFLRGRGIAFAAAVALVGSMIAAVWPSLALATFGFITTTGFVGAAIYWYLVGRD